MAVLFVSKMRLRKAIISAPCAFGVAVFCGLAVSNIETAAAATGVDSLRGANLSPQSVTAIQSQLATALKNRGTVGLGEPNDQAITAAIARATKEAVSTYGAGAADEIGSTIIAATSNVPCGDVGAGLGQATVLLVTTDFDAAKALALTVANEGTVCNRATFASALTGSLGPTQEAEILSEIATSSPVVTGSIGGGGVGFSFGSSLPPPLPPPPPPCGNPSCS